jgi:NAD(P)-dependent dehydrogenase (short-subunit alcohol dehydrogenase family)
MAARGGLGRAMSERLAASGAIVAAAPPEGRRACHQYLFGSLTTGG